jgi:hypothetical protein
MNRLGVWFSLVSVLALIGCVTAEEAPKSEWKGLGDVEKVDCAKWPLGEKDLGVNSVGFLDTKPQSLISTGRLRTSATVNYLTDFKGRANLDVDDLRRVDLGRTAVVLGTARMGTSSFLAVSVRTKNGRKLELRSTKDNIVRGSLDGFPSELASGSIVNVAGGFWVGLKEHEEKSSVWYVGVASGKLTLRSYPELNLRVLPIILPVRDEPQAWLLSYDALAAGQKRNDVFVMQKLSTEGVAGNERRLEVPVDSAVESWSASGASGRFLLAWVDGDSMVGEAKMRLGEIVIDYEAPRLAWENVFPLEDVHVSEPIWLTAGGSNWAVILKWVDEESTLATYKVGISNASPPRASGIFPKGSRLVDAFSDDDDDPWVIVRSRKKESWDFQVCELSRIQKD